MAVRMAVAPLQWRTFLFALVATAIFVAAVWIRTPPPYFTNDDVLIRLGIEGHLVPRQPPTGFVLVTHSALAWPLVWLQQRTTLPLWDLVTSGTLIWGIATLIAICWGALGAGWLSRGIAVGAVAIGALPLLGGVQFTISAVVAGAAAMVLAFVELATPQPRRSVVCMAALLLIVGELVRPMGAAVGSLAVGLMLAPFTLSAAMPQRWRWLVALTGAVAAVLIVSGTLQYTDRFPYWLDPAWDTYRQYHWTIARLVEWRGSKSFAELQALCPSVGWSANDWVMLTEYLGVDPAVHGVHQVVRACASMADEMTWWSRVDAIPARLAMLLEQGAVQRLFADSAAVLTLAAALAIVRGRLRGALVVAAAIAAFMLFCLATEVVYKELPMRLLAPLQLGLATVAIIAVGAMTGPASPLVSIIGLSFVLTLAARQHSAVTATLEADREQAAQVDEDARHIARLGPSLIVQHGDAFPAELFWRPFVQPAVTLSTIRLDFNNQSPHLQRFLTETGRQPLLRALCDDPSMLIVSKNPQQLELVTRYMREHFGEDVEWTRAFDSSFRAWRCTARSGP